MNTDKTDKDVRPDAAGPCILFGLRANDPAVHVLSLIGSAVIEGDSRNLNADDLRNFGAQRAVCSLFSGPYDPHNDAVSVIEALCAVGFTGEIIVLAPPLLRPKMVETELRNLARGRRLRLLAGVLAPLTEI